MIFNENNSDFIDVPKYKNSFVYFLLDNNEVVYIGKTIQGLARPLSHTDKIFNSIKIMYCAEEDLDYYENIYILKYTPIYNKQVNYKANYSFSMVKDLIRKNTSLKKFNKTDFKKITKSLGINSCVYYNVEIITVEEYEKIYNYIKEGKYEKCNRRV